MADKTAGKKQGQQKNKKGEQQEKKKIQENGVKHQNKLPVIVPNDISKKKKKKGNSKNSNNNFINNKSSKKKSTSNNRSLIRLFFLIATYVSLFLGFIYIVDYDIFVRMRDTASFYANKTVSLLPPVVVAKGRETVEIIRPVAEVTYNRVSVLLNETSTFVNTNPLIKDHWANIREISSVCSGLLVDYMRTLYLRTTGYCNDVKNKLFQ